MAAQWLSSGCMGMHQSGARISERDVTDLAIASDKLAVVAEQIKRANPSWSGTAVQLLIDVNHVVMRIQGKGAAAFARYLEKHGLQSPQDASEVPAAAELPPQVSRITEDDREA